MGVKMVLAVQCLDTQRRDRTNRWVGERKKGKISEEGCLNFFSKVECGFEASS